MLASFHRTNPAADQTASSTTNTMRFQAQSVGKNSLRSVGRESQHAEREGREQALRFEYWKRTPRQIERGEIGRDQQGHDGEQCQDRGMARCTTGDREPQTERGEKAGEHEPCGHDAHERQRVEPPVRMPSAHIVPRISQPPRALKMLPTHLPSKIDRFRNGVASRLSSVCPSRSPLTPLAARMATWRSMKTATTVPKLRIHMLITSPRRSSVPIGRIRSKKLATAMAGQNMAAIIRPVNSHVNQRRRQPVSIQSSFQTIGR